MTPETLSTFLLFAALMAGTPGPANMVALSAGARFERGLMIALGIATLATILWAMFLV